MIGQSKLPDVPQNYTQTIIMGQDQDVRYLIKSNLISSDVIKKKDNSHTYQLNNTIFNYKKKEIKGQLEFHGSTQITLHESTCLSGKIDENTFILPISLKQDEIYQCQFSITSK